MCRPQVKYKHRTIFVEGPASFCDSLKQHWVVRKTKWCYTSLLPFAVIFSDSFGEHMQVSSTTKTGVCRKKKIKILTVFLCLILKHLTHVSLLLSTCTRFSDSFGFYTGFTHMGTCIKICRLNFYFSTFDPNLYLSALYKILRQYLENKYNHQPRHIQCVDRLKFNLTQVFLFSKLYKFLWQFAALNG